MELIGSLLLAAWLSGADVLITPGPPTSVDVAMTEVPPPEVWGPLAQAVACWAYRHPVIEATGPVEIEFRARRRLETGELEFNSFHHASVPAAVLESCEREAPREKPGPEKPRREKPEDVTLSPESSRLDPRG
jgi:hypothetical protein